MKILALIAARGGSKRLPGKNKRLLGGKPLIAWSIDLAKDIPEICDTLVSTDDPEIAGIAEAAGGLVPWLRPAALATDTATSVDVALHAVDWYQKEHGPIDALMLLQPTSPFRRRETILRGLQLFTEKSPSAIVSVSTAHPHPAWCLKMDDGYLKPYSDVSGPQLRSQDLPAAYALDGVFYLVTPAALANSRTFVPAQTLPLLIDDAMEALDIDTEFDWQIAEAMCERASAA